MSVCVRVLVVAGSDSSAGAGIQADIKTVMALGGYATTAVTAVTAQSTHGVAGIFPVPAGMVALQMRLALDDIGADAVKTGMLGDAAVVEAVAQRYAESARGVPLVVDPVLRATDGSELLSADARRSLIGRLLPLAALVTPNAPEAESLTGLRIRTEGDLEQAALVVLALGPAAVLMKGSHLETETVVDLLVLRDGTRRRYESARLRSRSTHGTGCTLASAIAVGLAQGHPLDAAVERARRYVHSAILAAPDLGSGQGPLGHAGATNDSLVSNGMGSARRA